MSSDEPKIENFLLMPLLIYNKFSFLRWFENILLNKVDFGKITKSTLFSKMSSNGLQIENVLYISKGISGKFSILGSTEEKCGFFFSKCTLSECSKSKILDSRAYKLDWTDLISWFISFGLFSIFWMIY